MPFTPKRVKRNRMYGASPGSGSRRGSYNLGSVMRASKVLRSIGAPSIAHTFARPGRIMRLQSPTGAWTINGAPFDQFANGFSMGISNPGHIIGTTTISFGQQFQAGFLQRFSDLAQMYDNYRIKAVKVRIDFSYNSAPGVDASGSISAPSLPMMHYCVDPDDATAPSTESDVLEKSKSRSVRIGDRPVYINVVPRAVGVVSTSVAGGLSTASGTMLPYNTWLDCQNGQNVPHYGLKFWIEDLPIGVGATGNTNWCMTFTPVYILECKNIH